jgi:uncharacterized membrane protein
MSLFCLVIPLVFFLFWKSLSDKNGISVGGIWAVILGCILAFVQFITNPTFTSGEFGFLQWLIGFVNVVVFPVIIPFIICLMFMFLKIFSATINATNFLLLSCIPFGVSQTMTHSTQAEPLYLVIVPLIWIGLAVGLGFFVKTIPLVKRWISVLCIIGAVLLPFLGATAYWALYVQDYTLGYVLFGITLIPTVIHVGELWISLNQNKA